MFSRIFCRIWFLWNFSDNHTQTVTKGIPWLPYQWLTFEVRNSVGKSQVGKLGSTIFSQIFPTAVLLSNYVGEGSWKNWVVEEFYVLESKSYYLSWKVRNEFVRRTIFQLQETITIGKTHPTLNPSVFCTCWWSESLIKLSD